MNDPKEFLHAFHALFICFSTTVGSSHSPHRGSLKSLNSNLDEGSKVKYLFHMKSWNYQIWNLWMTIIVLLYLRSWYVWFWQFIDPKRGKTANTKEVNIIQVSQKCMFRYFRIMIYHQSQIAKKPSNYFFLDFYKVDQIFTVFPFQVVHGWPSSRYCYLCINQANPAHSSHSPRP